MSRRSVTQLHTPLTPYPKPLTQHPSPDRGRFYRLPLQRNQFRNSLLRQFQQVVHLLARKGRSFRSPLHFNEPAIACAYDIHIDFGTRIFIVFQIKHAVPSTMPTLTATTSQTIGDFVILRSFIRRLQAIASAT